MRLFIAFLLPFLSFFTIRKPISAIYLIMLIVTLSSGITSNAIAKVHNNSSSKKYFAFKVGTAVPQKMSDTRNLVNNNGGSLTTEADFKIHYNWGFVMGTLIEPINVITECEINYISLKAKSLNLETTPEIQNGKRNIEITEAGRYFSVFINLAYYFPAPPSVKLSFYTGGGLSAWSGSYQFEYQKSIDGPHKDFVVGYQALIGINFDISKRIVPFIEYKFLFVPGSLFLHKDTTGEDFLKAENNFKDNMKLHLLNFGVKILY